jgi:hypothetical protein
MTTTHSLRLTLSLITAAAFAGCGGGTNELGNSPDAGAGSSAGSTGASTGAGVAGAGGSSTVDAPVGGGSGGTSAQAGATGGATISSSAGSGGSGGLGGSAGTTKTGGSSGSSSCAPALSCNWCGGEYLKDANGCVTGYRCANGADPCKTSSCSASAPCAAGYTCSNMLCWPIDGGVGDAGGTDLCGGKVCGTGQACCGPAECGKCVNALSGQNCPSTCTATACGPSGAPCKTGEVCLDLVYQTTTSRTGTASCQPNPCGTEALSCTCAKSLCGNTATSCTLADAASGAVVCSTK